MKAIRLAALAATCVTVACSASSDILGTGPSNPEAYAAKGGVESSVTGNATIVLPYFGPAEQTYSNSAIQHADGSVSGQVEIKSEQVVIGGRVHASMVCFTVVGNEARMAAVVDQSTSTAVSVGNYLMWRVRDNGEGAKSPPDAMTDFSIATLVQANFHCATGSFLGPFFDAIRGNIQVH